MSWLTIILALALCGAAQAMDTWTTAQNLSGAGGTEYNPVERWSLRVFGSIFGVKALLIAPFILLFFISSAAGVVALLVFALMGLVASWLNIRHWKP